MKNTSIQVFVLCKSNAHRATHKNEAGSRNNVEISPVSVHFIK